MNKCSCVYVGLDYEGLPNPFLRTDPTARKEHICYECGRKILKGEKYCHESGKWYGRFGSYKTCADCISIRDEFFCEGFIYGDVISDLYSHIMEADGRIPEECLLSLTPGARGKVLGLIDEYFEDLDERGV